MDRKLIGAVLVFLACCGCCACQSCCDHLPPVLDGPYYTNGAMRSGYTNGAMRSGSAMNVHRSGPIEADKAITPLPVEE